MASKTESGEPAPGQHVCSHCAKPFARLCDLNKHSKSHSRPFKCAIQTCKYHEHGWPTAKELERHINDKHSVTPRTYACRFPPCTYKSKRESNCKQHMEKTHRWKYVRSKSNGKHMTPHHHDDLDHQVDITGGKPFPPMSSPGSSLVSPNQDFVLFPYDNDSSTALEEEGEDGDMPFDPHRAQDSQVYLPWTSPTTRIRRNENFIEMFTQTYNGAPERPAGNSDSLIDPGLPQYTHTDDAPGLGGSEPASLYPSQPLIKIETTNTAPGTIPLRKAQGRPGPVSEDLSDRRTRPAIQTASYESSGGRRPMFSAASAPDHVNAYSDLKSTLSRRRGDEGEGSDDEYPRPEKRRKSSQVENFSDTDMPDIFRFAHPRIYDRDQKEKFSPCHSSHRDISTLVRHLSRPAHRLQVHERFISSFDVSDPDYPHPRIGLCRRCWLAFPERQDFDDHIARSCEKVSKGKREKWRILLESFTPLIQEAGEDEQANGALGSEQGGSGVGSRRPSTFGTFSRSGDNPPSAAAPTSTGPIPHMGSRAIDPEFVPINEHMKLQKEHQILHREHRELHQKHQQLVQATRAILQQQSYQHSPATAAQRPMGPFMALRAGQPNSTLFSGHALRARSGVAEAADGITGKDTASDQESLVLHMDSQSTDVDIQGLMNEAPESLSRQNSGLSSISRSTIHHVPTSPPPLPSEEALSNCEDDECDEPPESCPSRCRPPPSIPDSAYGTDPRRCSLGEQGGQGGQQQVISGGSGNRNLDHPVPDTTTTQDTFLPLQLHNNRTTKPATTVVDETMAHAIAWSNPWAADESAQQQPPPPPLAAGHTASTMTAHNTFVNGEVEAGAAAVAPGAPEPASSFEDFYGLDIDLEHFGWNEMT